MDIQEQFKNLIQEEEMKYIESMENGEEYKKREFEILEWEIREVLENEGILIRENPLDFPPAVQRKYFWASAEDWKFPESVDCENEDWITPPGKYIQAISVQNPYTKEQRIIFKLFDVFIPPPPSNLEIGEKITQDVFDGNPYAQLADMVKAQVITLALLVPVLGKETVKAAYADLLVTVQKVSDARVAQGLEPYDLSFLD